MWIWSSYLGSHTRLKKAAPVCRLSSSVEPIKKAEHKENFPLCFPLCQRFRTFRSEFKCKGSFRFLLTGIFHISYLVSHISYLISHISFSFLTSHISYLISHIPYLISHFSYLISLILYFIFYV